MDILNQGEEFGSEKYCGSPMESDGKKVFVLGLGKSGIAAAFLARRMGAEVTIWDEKKENDFSTELLMELTERGVRAQFGSFHEETLSRSEQIIISPGISSDRPALRRVKERGIAITGEMEFAYSCLESLAKGFSKIPLVAITGTNGKTTTTAATGHILKQAGKEVFVGGNIGNPLSNLARDLMEKAPDAVVLEVSSYQLETINTFCPQVSVILNITPDHESRYASFSDYVAAKSNIFQNMKSGQLLMLNSEDPSTPMLKEMAQEKGIQVEMIALERGFEALFPGQHNFMNLGAARMIATHLGVSSEVIDEALRTFKPLAHRLECVGSCSGVSFYNDSKATNADSTRVALAALKGPLVWIAGGYQDPSCAQNEEPYRHLQEEAKGKVRTVLLLGETQTFLDKILHGVCPVRRCDCLGEAVALAYGLAESGDQILFSPGFKSFDRYENFEQRGEHFRRLVSRITGEFRTVSVSPTKDECRI